LLEGSIPEVCGGGLDTIQRERLELGLVDHNRGGETEEALDQMELVLGHK